MRITKRFNTIFHRLVFSYVILIIVTAIFMGTASYAYFTKHFNQEVEKAHRLMLDHVQGTFQRQVFDQMVKVYVELSANRQNQEHALLFFNHSVKPNHAKIAEAYDYLQYLAAANEGLIHSIDMYYRNNRMTISSTTGYQRVEPAAQWTQLDWLDSLDFSGSNFVWLDEAPSTITRSDGQKMMTLVASYPYRQDMANLGYVVINVDASKAMTLLQSKGSGLSSGNLFVVGPQTQYSTAGVVAPEDVLASVGEASEESGNRVVDVGGSEHMVTHNSFTSPPGWKLVSMAPINQFYEKSATIHQMLLVIGLVSIALGVLVSNVFTNQIYHPLRSLLERTKDLFRDGVGPRKSANEYVQINTLIDNLSVKVNQLEDTLQANLPLVKQSFVSSLLQHMVVGEEQLHDYLRLMGIPNPPRYCSALAFRFDEEMVNKLNVENAQFLMYHFIERLESGNSKDLLCLAVKTSDFGVGAIVFSDSPVEETLIKRIEYVQSYTYANFMFQVVASVGPWTEQLLEAGQSYQAAMNQLQYRYLFPDIEVFTGESWQLREEGVETIDGSWVQRWMKVLKANDLPAAEEVLQQVKSRLREGRFSTVYAKQAAHDAVHMFRQFLFEVSLDKDELLAEETARLAAGTETIEQWEERVMLAVSRAFSLLKERSENRSLHVIDKVKEHIRNHLAVDLSLNAVADQVSLNPAYLSRMFKSLTGTNYVDYVTSERMSKAKELLQTSSENIEQIALSVGYYNPAYFTKKFKETFGMTPSEFRMNSQQS
ncbi:helix-turn-helix transcriptional regulator [Paenibacillus turpanensis]|uniref:helix-turn-helix transcriptional regulator n=1 Tax=Paenibacillus turpanensis TaxID=2689078 RepID=UPI00140B8BD9|nr:helix-turn-helix domain-containing protein [Paenibacillus turpanensis]